jgi:hypothetical protein
MPPPLEPEPFQPGKRGKYGCGHSLLLAAISATALLLALLYFGRVWERGFENSGDSPRWDIGPGDVLVLTVLLLVAIVSGVAAVVVPFVGLGRDGGRYGGREPPPWPKEARGEEGGPPQQEAGPADPQ